MLKRILMVGIALMITACGGESGEKAGGGNVNIPATNPNAPTLSAVTFSPTSASLNQGGGAIEVAFSFTVADTQGDVTKIIINVFDSNNANVAAYTGAATTGENHSFLMADTTQRGTYRIEAYVEDAANNTSNRIGGTFTVN